MPPKIKKLKPYDPKTEKKVSQKDIASTSKVGKPHATTWTLKPASLKVNKKRKPGEGKINTAAEGFKPTYSMPSGMATTVAEPERELMTMIPRKKPKKSKPVSRKGRKVSEGKDVSTWKI